MSVTQKGIRALRTLKCTKPLRLLELNLVRSHMVSDGGFGFFLCDFSIEEDIEAVHTPFPICTVRHFVGRQNL